MNYPRRESHFAHRFVRVLHKSCAAQELGPVTCWLLAVIAHTEDAARYSGPVTFWNPQLMETMGFRSPKQLDDARNRAIAGGWLAYERKGTRQPGQYFVMIPQRYENLPDTPLESTQPAPGILSAGGKNSGMNQQGFFPNTTIIGEGTRNESVKESGKPSTLSLSLSLKKKGAAHPVSYSADFETFWGCYPKQRRKAKRSAWATWLKAIKRAEPATILAAVKEYAASDVGRGEYVKGPEPWLNGDCWEDDRAAWGRHSHNGQTVSQYAPLSADMPKPQPRRAAK